jgi:hypothetical protein
MKANELRIGNYLNDTEVGSKESFKVMIGDIAEIYDHTDCSENYEPILLTKDWLIKFGFTFVNETRHWYILFKREGSPEDMIFFIGFDKIMKYWFGIQNPVMDTVAINTVKYVHQLQNIYFALTGEELILKQ